MGSLYRIQFAPRAERDLRKLDGQVRRRVRDALERLAAGTDTLDVKTISGHPGWLRLRVGEHRVLYRPLSPQEAGGEPSWLIARIVDRKEPRTRRSQAAVTRGDEIYRWCRVYTDGMSKHLVDIDERALRAAREELGTDTIKDTVNQALHRAGRDHAATVKERLDLLARADLARREEAWR